LSDFLSGFLLWLFLLFFFPIIFSFLVTLTFGGLNLCD
jgi:hypothetical protein